MGQYWIPVNLDKKEFLDPHKLGAGLKLVEQFDSPVVNAVFMLCAAMPVRRGGGDFDHDADPDREVIGRWAGDRIAWVGDYAEDSDLPAEHEASKIYMRCMADPDEGGDAAWTDITGLVVPQVEKALRIRLTGTGWRDIEEAG